MVSIKYFGTGLYTVGGYNNIPSYTFKKGVSTDVLEDHFYEFMKNKSFAYRVDENLLQVPREIPLIRSNLIEHQEDESTKNLSSLKGILKAIEETFDYDFLNSVLESDPRDKVKKAIELRLKNLESNK